MPVTFGSVGDIISVCLLIKDLVEALNESRGSSNQYRELTKQLELLERTLLEIDVLARKHDNTPELNAICVTAGEAAQRCRVSIERMLARTKRYDRSLGVHSGTGGMTKAARKVQWRVLEKDELNRFQGEVTAHAQSLAMLLSSASFAMADVQGRLTRESINEATERLTTSNQEQDRVLASVLTRVNQMATSVTLFGNALWQGPVSSSLSWLRQLGEDITAWMRQIYDMNVLIYEAVKAMHAKLSLLTAQLLLTQGSCMFEDALGRRAPMPLNFINSWECFDAVLQARFHALKGYKKVVNREYALLDAKSGQDIERSVPWSGAFLPGQYVNMEMLCRTKTVATNESLRKALSVCLRCSMLCESAGQQVECSSCGFCYRRLMQVVESNESFYGEESSHTLHPIILPPPTEYPTLPPASPDNRLFDEEENPSHFKRVRLCCNVAKQSNEEQIISPAHNKVTDTEDDVDEDFVRPEPSSPRPWKHKPGRRNSISRKSAAVPQIRESQEELHDALMIRSRSGDRRGHASSLASYKTAETRIPSTNHAGAARRPRPGSRRSAYHSDYESKRRLSTQDDEVDASNGLPSIDGVLDSNDSRDPIPRIGSPFSGSPFSYEALKGGLPPSVGRCTCKVEFVTYVYPDGRRLKQPYMSLCANSNGSQPCLGARYYDSGIRYKTSDMEPVDVEALEQRHSDGLQLRTPGPPLAFRDGFLTDERKLRKHKRHP